MTEAKVFVRLLGTSAVDCVTISADAYVMELRKVAADCFKRALDVDTANTQLRSRDAQVYDLTKKVSDYPSILASTPTTPIELAKGAILFRFRNE